MTGEELKTKLNALHVSQSELARKLGISQQTFNQMLKVADVKTGLIEKIAKTMGVNLSFFYGDSAATVTTVTTGDNNKGNINTGTCSGTTICGPSDHDCARIIEELKQHVARLEGENDVLKSERSRLMKWIDKLLEINK